MALNLDDYTGSNDEKVAQLLAAGVAEGYQITPLIMNKEKYYDLMKGTGDSHEFCEVKLDGDWIDGFPKL